MDFVGVGPARDIEQVCDVLCARASGVRSCKSCVPQSREGMIKPVAWVANLGLVFLGNVDARVEVRIGDDLVYPQSQTSPSWTTPGLKWLSGRRPLPPCVAPRSPLPTGSTR